MLWWEVTGVNSSRLERSLSNATLQHQLTGLTSVTSYTILVAARTVAGPGQTTASTVSTGVPPGKRTPPPPPPPSPSTTTRRRPPTRASANKCVGSYDVDLQRKVFFEPLR